MSKAFGFTEYGGPQHQVFLDRPVPVPGPGQLQIAVRAAGVNPIDWKIRRGLTGKGLDLPAVLGVEAAGVVEAVGEGATGFAVGDHVFGTTVGGGYAQHALLTAASAARKPAGVSFLQAAALPVAAATGYDGVEDIGLKAGQTLLVLGIAGGVGSVAAQIARERGIGVLGTASDARRAYVEELGATWIRYGDGAAERILAAAPEGVDGILDLIGGADARAAAETLADRSRLVATSDPGTAAELGGSFIRRSPAGPTLAKLADLVATGRLDQKITATYPLEQAAEALAEVEAGHARGKLILEVS
ncbi:NADP-dependent oxidoreductase [Kitasatospora sp. NPDC094015]|uniref:NADP-dependent oxidoreductase n=1 Tax=Kitasatospora sp. NPDC094015 TaxID=3155205 RepID=UPI0033236518